MASRGNTNMCQRPDFSFCAELNVRRKIPHGLDDAGRRVEVKIGHRPAEIRNISQTINFLEIGHFLEIASKIYLEVVRLKKSAIWLDTLLCVHLLLRGCNASALQRCLPNIA